MKEFEKVLQDFPIFQHRPSLIYLDSAATTQKPISVIAAESEFYQNDYGTVHRGIYELSRQATEKYNQSRQTVARFLKAKNEHEIVFTRGTTDSINLVAESFGSLLQEGDEIIISEMEHHSNIVPWQMLAEKKNLCLKIIPINDRAELRIEEFEKLLSPRTKLVSIAHIANATGTINPIETIIAMAHAKGAKVLIDGAQAAGHMAVDVQKLDVDFYAFSSHKIYGPTGVGVLYGKYALLEQMPPVQGGGDMIEQVTLENTTFQKPPLRFEAGTPMIAQVIALKAAIEYIERLGLEKIHQHEQKLLEFAQLEMKKIEGIRLIGTAKNKGAILTFVHEHIHPLDLATFLDLDHIAIRTGHHCAEPTMKRFGVQSAARISFGVYNTIEQLEKFFVSLKSVIYQVQK